jgi:predicted  nucleic acid-binding Zn-ribbon protein
VPVVECDRCGEEYDTNRETPKPMMSSDRCPSCGCENTANAELVTESTDGMPGSMEEVVKAVGADDGEVHLHFHQH